MVEKSWWFCKEKSLIKLDRLKDGNFGDYKQLNDYLYELRFNFGSGYRIYYTIENETIVLLINAGNKKSQTRDITSANEIINKLRGISHEKYKRF